MRQTKLKIERTKGVKIQATRPALTMLKENSQEPNEVKLARTQEDRGEKGTNIIIKAEKVVNECSNEIVATTVGLMRRGKKT